MNECATRSAAERVARESYGRLLAYLGGRTGDIASAEDALADAFVTALQKWPISGVPDNPDGWLLRVAQRRKLDDWRKHKVRTENIDHLLIVAEELLTRADTEQDIPDRRLALMFACADPQIDPVARTPLILQTVLGLTANDIAARFLVTPKTMGQRLVRAKSRIKDARIAFAIPEREEFPSRLSSVLSAIYAAYSSDWLDTSTEGTTLLYMEAVWLARVVVLLMPTEPEPKGLLALLLYSEARRSARHDQSGRLVPLDFQDTGAWDRELVHEADGLLRQASGTGATGRFQIEAAIQSAHIVRRLVGVANWDAILTLYDFLERIVPSPVVRLNRVAARAQAGDIRLALNEITAMSGDPGMMDYLPYWATRAQLHADLGHRGAAVDAFTIAIGLCQSQAERGYLETQRRKIGQ